MALMDLLKVAIADMSDALLVKRWRANAFPEAIRDEAEAELRRRGIDPADAVVPEKSASTAPAPNNWTPVRLLIAIALSPSLGGFLWGVYNAPSGWTSFAGRILHGALALVTAPTMVLAMPARVPYWPYIAVAFLLLTWASIRWPAQSSQKDSKL